MRAKITSSRMAVLCRPCAVRFEEQLLDDDRENRMIMAVRMVYGVLLYHEITLASCYIIRLLTTSSAAILWMKEGITIGPTSGHHHRHHSD